MKTLLIVYHSRTGGTRQMAEAAATGAAAEPCVDVRLLQATAAGPGDVLAADQLEGHGDRLGRGFLGAGRAGQGRQEQQCSGEHASHAKVPPRL